LLAAAIGFVHGLTKGLLVRPQATTLRARSKHEGEQISEASEAITAKGDQKGAISTDIRVLWLPRCYHCAERYRVLQSH
jgi:hypothetical protein